MQSIVRRISIGLLFALMLTACGFQLRGITELSFKNLFIQGTPLSISRELKQSLKANGIQVVKSSEQAELLLELLNETNEKKILSLSGTGVVREFELFYQVSFRTREPNNPIWSTPQTVQTRRDFSYNDNALLGKAEEEVMLNNDMHKDAIREVIRRLSAIKLTVK
jgi:LPS-assembly lipoprotein